MSAPTAHWPTNSLLTSLARAGWGDELGSRRKGVRAVLSALVELLPPVSGQGPATVEQVAGASGYSARWVAVCLAELEKDGVIEWRRDAGFIRINKGVLVDLIGAARRS